jgi:hypothetical protein
MSTGPFAALGLPADPHLTDEQVRAAWLNIATATHPDRPDGGHIARYTAAASAYAQPGRHHASPPSRHRHKIILETWPTTVYDASITRS